MAENKQKKQIIEFICNSCGYKFTMKKSTRIRKRCPYCSSKDVEEHHPLKADDLI